MGRERVGVDEGIKLYRQLNAVVGRLTNNSESQILLVRRPITAGENNNSKLFPAWDGKGLGLMKG